MVRRTLLAVALVVSSVAAEDRRADRGRLVVMTWSTQLLSDGGQQEGRAALPPKRSPAEARAHMSRVADIVRRADADIVSLLEVENEGALTRLRDDFLADRGYEVHFVEGTDPLPGMGLLTRIDPAEIGRFDGKGRSGAVERSVPRNYWAKLEAGDLRIALLGLHLLAMPHMASRRLQREAQADAIRVRAVELQAEGFQVILLGDFNDYDGSVEARDHIDSTPITRTLAIARSMDPTKREDDLWNAAMLAPKPTRYTAHWDQNGNGTAEANELTSIDHVLLSPGLWPLATGTEMRHDHDPLEGPDHFPVIVQLQLWTRGTVRDAVRVVRLLPRASEKAVRSELVTLTNLGDETVPLEGWMLRDASGKTWALDELGTLSPGETKTIERGGSRAAGDDALELLDGQGAVVQVMTSPGVDRMFALSEQGKIEPLQPGMNGEALIVAKVPGSDEGRWTRTDEGSADREYRLPYRLGTSAGGLSLVPFLVVEGGAIEYQPDRGPYLGSAFLVIRDEADPDRSELPRPSWFMLLANAGRVSPNMVEVREPGRPYPVQFTADSITGDQVRLTAVPGRSEDPAERAVVSVDVRRPSLQVRAPARIQGFGLQSCRVDVSTDHAGVRKVALAADRGSLVPAEVELDASGHGATTFFSSGLTGATIRVVNPGLRADPVAITFVFPFAFLASALVGGVIGGVIGRHLASSKQPCAQAIAWGALIGIVAAVATALGINLLVIDLVPLYAGRGFSEGLVFTIALIGALFGFRRLGKAEESS